MPTTITTRSSTSSKTNSSSNNNLSFINIKARKTTATSISIKRTGFIMISSLQIYSISLLLFSSFFWAWALKNTISMESPNFDLGLISFLTVMLTSSYLLGIANNNNNRNSSSSTTIVIGKLTRILATCSYIFVAANYILGAYIGYTKLQRIGFTIYCAIFAFIWFGITGIGIKIMSSPSSSTQATSGERQNLC